MAMMIWHVKARTCYWDGGAGTSAWSDAVNWSDDVLPAAGDEVILDNRVVHDRYQVELPGGEAAVSIGRLWIHPEGVPITLVLPSTNTSVTAFRATNEGDAIQLDAEAVLINASGAGLSSTPLAVTSQGWFRINNGGRYIHRTARSATDNLLSRLSQEPGTERGVFEFDVTVASYIVSLSGRSFGTLELSALANAGTVSYRGSGGLPCRVRGDLLLGAGVSFSLSLSADFGIQGGAFLSSASVFNLQSSDHDNQVFVAGPVTVLGSLSVSGSGHPVLLFTGSAEQRVAVAEAIPCVITLSVNNTSGLALDRPLDVSGLLMLNQGNIRTNDSATVVFREAAGWAGGSPYSFIDGPAERIGAEGFTFPVGAGQIFAPLKVGAASQADPESVTRVTYLRGNPATSVGHLLDPGSQPAIDHISSAEYWRIHQAAGHTRLLELPVNQESFCRNLASSFVVVYPPSGAGWRALTTEVSEGPVIDGSYQTGKLRSTQSFQGAGFLSIGTGDPRTDNPLPVRTPPAADSMIGSGALPDALRFVPHPATDMTAVVLPASFRRKRPSVIDLRLIDLHGREVRRIEAGIPAGEASIKLSLQGIGTGVYLVVLRVRNDEPAMAAGLLLVKK